MLWQAVLRKKLVWKCASYCLRDFLTSFAPSAGTGVAVTTSMSAKRAIKKRTMRDCIVDYVVRERRTNRRQRGRGKQIK